jgi:hypothetical protein
MGVQEFATAVIAPNTSLYSGFYGTAFRGSFDGNNHKITHLTINGGNNNYYLGLFGYIDSDGSVKNLGIENCAVSGSYIGGLVGENRGSISNCYSTGTVNGPGYVGGLVGYNDHGSISNCHSTVNVSGGSYNEGGLVGFSDSGNISNCYSTGTVIGSSNAWDVGGLVGWSGYSNISNCYSTGAVSGPSASFVGGLVGINGNGSNISNCYSTGTVSGSSDIGGLVGQSSDSTNISDCYSTGTVSGTDYVGGLVGFSSNDINNCCSTGTVITSSTSTYAGGLVGYKNNGDISNCYSTGPVSGSSNSHEVGGLVGHNASGSISSCSSKGTVNGTYYVGGLVGENDDYGSISNCYSIGSVSGYQYVGGLVGRNYGGSIMNCYSIGSVSGSSSVGGLSGYNNGGSIINSFWDVNTSGQTTSAGGTGKTTAEMKTKSTFTDVGWDFITIWAIYDGTSYPWLSPIITSATPPPNTPGDALKPVNPITTPPDGNLKRWDGQLWQSVRSWNDANIHTDQPTLVLAHGWKTADGDANIFASDSKISEIAKALYTQNSSANILAWELQGLHINNGNLQLIGHSNGGAVIGGAASELAISGQKVKRITTLDTPNLYLRDIPAAFLFPSLWKFLSSNVNAMQYIHPETASQIEVYYSDGPLGRAALGFGAPLNNSNTNNVFNGQIYQGLALTLIDLLIPQPQLDIDHFRIIDWYADDMSGTVAPDGLFVAGINWSILSPQAGNLKYGRYAEQQLNSHLFDSIDFPHLTNPFLWLAKLNVYNFSEGRSWYGQHAVIVAIGNNDNYAAQIQSGSDGFLWQEMSIPQNASYLTFDMKVETPEAGDFLTVSFGNEVIYYKSLNTADSNFWTVDPIFVGDFAGQTETLLFAINHVGDGTPSILLDNITFSAINFPPRPITVDLNNDGIPNFYDFSIFANFWQNSSCSEPNWCNGSDFDKNGIVDIHDLQVFAEFWLWPVADLDLDRGVDFVDFNILANQWLNNCSSPDWCYGSDFNKSGSVNFVDFAIFAKYWLEGF